MPVHGYGARIEPWGTYFSMDGERLQHFRVDRAGDKHGSVPHTNIEEAISLKLQHLAT